MSAASEDGAEREHIERNIRRTVGGKVLREMSTLADEIEREEAVRRRLLRAVLRYGWVVLLLAAALSAHYLGVV